MSISYEGIGAWCATFAAGTGAEEGKGVKVSAHSGETAPAVGWNLLAADGNGGVSVVTSGGHSYLAVEVDTTGKTMTIML